MVGKKTWQTSDIIRILQARRAGKSFVDILTLHNAKSKHHAAGLQPIRYVWNTYMKDPSYNHTFSEQEEEFIMRRFDARYTNQDILNRFREEFPVHAWQFANPITAIESFIAEKLGDPERIQNFSVAEVSFMMGRHHAGEKTQDILGRFLVEFPNHHWQDCVDQQSSVNSTIATHAANPEFDRKWEPEEVTFILSAKAGGWRFDAISEKFKERFPHRKISFAETIYAFWRHVVGPKHAIPQKLAQNVTHNQPRIQVQQPKLPPKGKSRADHAASGPCNIPSYRVSKPSNQANSFSKAVQRGEIIFKDKQHDSCCHSEPTALSAESFYYHRPPSKSTSSISQHERSLTTGTRTVPNQAVCSRPDLGHFNLSSPNLHPTGEPNIDVAAQAYPWSQNLHCGEASNLHAQTCRSASTQLESPGEFPEWYFGNMDYQLPPLYQPEDTEQEPAAMSNLWSADWIASQAPGVSFPGCISQDDQEPSNTRILLPPISTAQQHLRDPLEQEMDGFVTPQGCFPRGFDVLLHPVDTDSDDELLPASNSKRLPTIAEVDEDLGLDFLATQSFVLDPQGNSLSLSLDPATELPDTSTTRMEWLLKPVLLNYNNPMFQGSQEESHTGFPSQELISTTLDPSALTPMQVSPESPISNGLEQNTQLDPKFHVTPSADSSSTLSQGREDKSSSSQSFHTPHEETSSPQHFSSMEVDISTEDLDDFFFEG